MKVKITHFKCVPLIVSLFLLQFICGLAFAGSVGPGDGLVADAEHLKESVSQWGTTAAMTAILFSGSIAVISMILPIRFLKETLGRSAWIGLACAVLTFIILSFFGNSIHQATSKMFQCPLQIIGLPCS